MSSLDLSDPHIIMAWDAIAHNDPLRWFLLAYGDKPNGLTLCASGTGDIEELRSHLTPGNVHYGLFREQSLHVSLSYIPETVSGVKRARALVHARAVSLKFKAHQMLNASNPDQVTVDALRSALRLPPRNSQRSALQGLGGPPLSSSMSRKPSSGMRSASLFTSPNPTDGGIAHARSTSSPLTASPNIHAPADSESGVPSPGPEDSMANSTLPTSSAPHKPTPSPLANITTPNRTNSPPLTSPALHSVFSMPSSPGSGFTNGAQVPRSPQSPLHASWLAKQDAPLPPPPSEEPQAKGRPKEQRVVEHEQERYSERSASPHMGSIPDSQSVASHQSSTRTSSPPPPHPPPGLSKPLYNGTRSGSPQRRPQGAVDGLPGPSLSSPFSAQLDPPPRTAAQEEAFRSRSKWTAEEDTTKNPPPHDDPPDLRAPQRTRSRFQARGMAGAGADRDSEDERRLVVLDEERRRRATERAKREKEEREEEEARQREFEERKERDKMRRLELAQKAEKRRAEQHRRQEEEERHQKEEKARKEEEVRERRSHIQKRFEKQKGLDLLSGFITLESSSSWKRRYYRLSTEDWLFFKSDREVTHPMHAIELSRVRALREWNEGYEELEAIPHSFAVELKDGAPWLFFADSSEDKEILLGLLNQAAGL